jgi:hypothetical protein
MPPGRRESKLTVRNLRGLTGRESGIIIFGKRAGLCNWTNVKGFPRMHGFGIMGSSKSIPRVFGVHKGDLSDVFQGVMIGNYTLDDFEYRVVLFTIWEMTPRL